MALYYLDKEQSQSFAKETPKESRTKKLEEFTAPNIEDAITKIVKLLANLSTEENFALIAF